LVGLKVEEGAEYDVDAVFLLFSEFMRLCCIGQNREAREARLLSLEFGYERAT